MAKPFRNYPDRIVGLNGVAFISANEVLSRGKVEHALIIGNERNDHRMDLTRDDAFTRAYHDVLSNAMTTLRTNPILAKPTWNKDDRMAWEAMASSVVRIATSQHPLFANYRTDGNISPDTGRIVEATHDLNRLRLDSEFDCDKMSTVMATMLQTLESRLLPAIAADGDWRRQTQYYLASGIITDVDRGNATSVLHGWITSAATGNVIDATAPRDTYRMSAQADYDFEKAIAGYPAIVRRATVTTTVDGNQRAAPAPEAPHELYHQGFAHTTDDLALVAHRLASLRQGNIPEAPTAKQLRFHESFGEDKGRLGALLNSKTRQAALQDDYRPTEADTKHPMLPSIMKEAATDGRNEMFELWSRVTGEKSSCGFLLTPEEIGSLRNMAEKYPQSVAIFENGTRIQGNAKGVGTALVIEAGKVLLYKTDASWGNYEMNQSFPSDGQCKQFPPRPPDSPMR
jgi:hypothetical protein